MNLVDSCGWLEYVADGPNARFFAEPIEDIDSLLVPSICVLEVIKVLLRDRGESLAVKVAAGMRKGRLAPLDEELATRAARISVDGRLPTADAIIVATARAFDATIWTQDAHFAGIEGVHYKAK